MNAAKRLRVEDARRVKSAEVWLRLGEPAQALRALKRVTPRAWNHPGIERLVWRAAQALG